MEAVMDKGRISVEIVRLRTNIEQWERDLRNANRDRHYAAIGRAAGAVLFAVGVLAALLSYTLMGVYISTVGMGIVLVSMVREGGSRDRLRNLDDQLVYSKRRLVELNIRLENDPLKLERSRP